MNPYKNSKKIVPIDTPVLIIPPRKIIRIDNNINQTISMLPPLKFIELCPPNSSKNNFFLSKVKLQPKFHTTSPKATKSKKFNKSYSTSPKATKFKKFDKSCSTSPKVSRKTDIQNIKQKSESKLLKRTNVIPFEKNWHKLSYKQINTIKTLLSPYYSTCDLDLMILGLEKQKL